MIASTMAIVSLFLSGLAILISLASVLIDLGRTRRALRRLEDLERDR